MRIALLACLLSAAFLGAAVAQQPQALPQVRVQTPPALAGRLSSRQLELLRAAGVTQPPAGVQATVHVSANRPVTENARLSFFVVNNYTPSREGDGSIQMNPNPGAADVSWVQVNFAADATSRYIVDCAVSGVSTSRYRFVRMVGEGGAQRREQTEVSVSGGRVGMVLQPRGAAGGEGVYLMGLGAYGWNFHSCDITPVS